MNHASFSWLWNPESLPDLDMYHVMTPYESNPLANSWWWKEKRKTENPGEITLKSGLCAVFDICACFWGQRERLHTLINNNSIRTPLPHATGVSDFRWQLYGQFSAAQLALCFIWQKLWLYLKYRRHETDSSTESLVDCKSCFNTSWTHTELIIFKFGEIGR